MPLSLRLRPAEVDPPDGRGLAELELQKLGAVLPGHESGPFRDATFVLGELDGRADLVALPLALLLVGGDPVAAAGGDVLQAQEIPQWRVEQGVAALADVRSRAFGDLVQVAAGAAQLRALGRQAVSVGSRLTGRMTLLTR